MIVFAVEFIIFIMIFNCQKSSYLKDWTGQWISLLYNSDRLQFAELWVHLFKFIELTIQLLE